TKYRIGSACNTAQVPGFFPTTDEGYFPIQEAPFRKKKPLGDLFAVHRHRTATQKLASLALALGSASLDHKIQYVDTRSAQTCARQGSRRRRGEYFIEQSF